MNYLVKILKIKNLIVPQCPLCFTELKYCNWCPGDENRLNKYYRRTGNVTDRACKKVALWVMYFLIQFYFVEIEGSPRLPVCVCVRVGSIGSMKFNGVCEVLILVDTAVPQCYRWLYVVSRSMTTGFVMSQHECCHFMVSSCKHRQHRACFQKLQEEIVISKSSHWSSSQQEDDTKKGNLSNQRRSRGIIPLFVTLLISCRVLHILLSK